MRNAFANLNRHCHRHVTFASRTLHRDSAFNYDLWKCITLRDLKDIGLARRFSTSVHGERPSGEYARWRKESLESEFGITLGAYSSKSASIFSRFGPFLAFYRAAIISFHVLKLAIWQIFVHDINKRAVTVIFNIEANYTFKFFGYNLQLVNA